ncbi:MAG: DUF177 domain-containing protein [Microbacteriaceae bacterium]
MSKKQVTVWDLPVRDLIHHPGEMREVEIEFPNPERLGEGVIAVAENAAISLDARLESVHEGILVSGNVETEAIGECVRCLNEVILPIAVNFQELFGYELAEGVDYQVQDDHVNLEQVVRDAVVLSLPFSPVCEDGCEKPTLAEGITVVLADDEGEPEIDPRWGKLNQLLAESADESTTTEK